MKLYFLVGAPPFTGAFWLLIGMVVFIVFMNLVGDEFLEWVKKVKTRFKKPD